MNTETEKWRFLDTGKGNAIFNMAMDEALVTSVRKGNSSPVFRLFEWENDAITFGYSQNVSDIIDIVKCKSDGIEITRRLTGGRAVYHKNEIAYSVVGFTDDRCFGGSIIDTYGSISRVLADGLKMIGIKAEISSEKPSYIPLQRQKTEPCFLTASRFEITLDGNKLVGSAQRRFKNLFIQQGSILTGPGSEKVAEYMKNENLTVEYGKLLAERTINLKSQSDGQFSVNNLKKSLFHSFEIASGIHCEHENPTEEELKNTEQLISGRYGSEGWVHGHG
ncbi:biotin/lipoate A/B protein ligase family protein [Candidatus Latescibacterota bacterium]